MEPTEKQHEVISSDGHLLVTGGPGSGKTTISILKAAQIADYNLRPQQKVLFLSFARATIARVIEAIEEEKSISDNIKRHIEVETYHSFFWRILKAHGYLLGLPRKLDILTPPEEAIALSSTRSQFEPDSKLSDEKKKEKKDAENAERCRLAADEGRVCFDLFAPFVSSLLHSSQRLRQLLATMHPAVVLDEFQDTNAEQWNVVQALGRYSRLIALADPEQRIFDFIGADPDRLDHFRKAFTPTEIDFSDTNHRSAGTDIAKFGNAILKGTFDQENYEGIEVKYFDSNPNQAFTTLITSTYAARKRLAKSGKQDWSLAILVPTKKMTRLVSDKFRAPPAGMPAINHTAMIEMAAAILGSGIIAHILQPDSASRLDTFISLMCSYYQGKGGDKPTKTALDEAARIRKAYDKWCSAINSGKKPPGKSILHATFEVYDTACAKLRTGEPNQDWQTVRAVLENGKCKRLTEIAKEVRNIRLLERGTQLREDLTQDWRDNGSYANASLIVQQAFVQEHFASSAKPETGVVVMNMHKAKGKQFDEVIIFEGWPNISRLKIVANLDRIVRFNDRTKVDASCRQNFRVSITRGRQRTTILTPEVDPCVLLIPEQ
ncbi:UvrD-helicase domain-containing protein [Thalassospira tepidiphila]|jgi:DNA helicase-2/ATP-dependent DNA helicase PcrA|uniref:DNA 3'-5' helicase II n=2 Tax=Thalassospira tepidiphila TaxID=393657 RepID=A0A853L0D7_9PROT|nr:ATP-dependent helicase [Thalassospira tepidiphila]NJB74929.1 DNA helicase-2/ATP-dependent DNA helicase PcrA [Thalassospira tepidiphila]OAZ10329.1 ATPase AAA [Thalassospira tepidiphila MCCC 1A03514]